jgi:soluble lytic murein transglycosylase-like protein
MGTAGKMLLMAAVAILFYGQSLARADVYTYVDAKGTRYYTNVPAASTCRLYQRDTNAISKPSTQAWPEVRIGGRSSLRNTGVDSAAYDRQIKQSGKDHNVDPLLIKAIIKAESGFNCNAQSNKGAQGLMQLMPGTARDLKVANPFDPRANIDGGTRYFSDILKDFNGNIPLSLAAYNAGPNLVKRTNQIPQIPETREYIQRVLQHYKSYKGYQGLGSHTPLAGSTIRVGGLVTVQ